MAPRPSGVAISKNSVGTFFTTSAKTLKLAAPRGMSMWEARLLGLPVSAHSASRNSSKRALISATRASRSSTRRVSVIRPQGPFRAARAAATAASTSALPASATRPITAWVVGVRLSNHWPVATYSPLMKLRMSCCMVDVLVCGVRSRRVGSGHHGEEAFVQLPVVVEDVGAHFLPGPGLHRLIGVGVVALGEGLEAVARGVEGVDGLAAGDAVAGGTDVDGHLVHGHDVGRAQHPLPGGQQEGEVVELPRLGVAHEGQIVSLVAAGDEDGEPRLAVFHEHLFDQVEAQHFGEELEHAVDVGAVEQAVVEAQRGDAMLGLGRPGGGG